MWEVMRVWEVWNVWEEGMGLKMGAGLFEMHFLTELPQWNEWQQGGNIIVHTFIVQSDANWSAISSRCTRCTRMKSARRAGSARPCIFVSEIWKARTCRGGSH